MYKLWCIFLMQLFNFTPLKCYDLCAGALALTLGGPEVGVLRDCYHLFFVETDEYSIKFEAARFLYSAFLQ